MHQYFSAITRYLDIINYNKVKCPSLVLLIKRALIIFLKIDVNQLYIEVASCLKYNVKTCILNDEKLRTAYLPLYMFTHRNNFANLKTKHLLLISTSVCMFKTDKSERLTKLIFGSRRQ